MGFSGLKIISHNVSDPAPDVAPPVSSLTLIKWFQKVNSRTKPESPLSHKESQPPHKTVIATPRGDLRNVKIWSGDQILTS